MVKSKGSEHFDRAVLTSELEEDPLQEIHSHSVTYRIAVGPQKGRKVFTLQTIPPQAEESPDKARAANLNGFSLHAGVAAKAYQRKKVEQIMYTYFDFLIMFLRCV